MGHGFHDLAALYTVQAKEMDVEVPCAVSTGNQTLAALSEDPKKPKNRSVPEHSPEVTPVDEPQDQEDGSGEANLPKKKLQLTKISGYSFIVIRLLSILMGCSYTLTDRLVFFLTLTVS